MITKERFCEICEEAGLIKKLDMFTGDILLWYSYKDIEIAEFDDTNECAIVIMDFSILGDGTILESYFNKKIISDDETKLRKAISKSLQNYKKLVKSIRRKKIDEL